MRIIKHDQKHCSTHYGQWHTYLEHRNWQGLYSAKLTMYVGSFLELAGYLAPDYRYSQKWMGTYILLLLPTEVKYNLCM